MKHRSKATSEQTANIDSIHSNSQLNMYKKTNGQSLRAGHIVSDTICMSSMV